MAKGKGFGKKGGKGRILQDKQTTRGVEFILYPDMIKVPKDEDGRNLTTAYGRILSFADSCGMKGAVSPFHNQDVFDLEDVIAYRDSYAARMGLESTAEEVIKNTPDVGASKEPHWHMHMYNKAPHKADYWLEVISPLCDYPRWRLCCIEDAYTATRYLAHLDSKDKPHYKAEQVFGFGGIDLSPLYETDEIKGVNAIKELREAITENRIRYYYQLFDFALSSGDVEWIRCVQGRTSMWASFLNSRNAHDSAMKDARKGKSGGNVERMLG